MITFPTTLNSDYQTVTSLILPRHRLKLTTHPRLQRLPINLVVPRVAQLPGLAMKKWRFNYWTSHINHAVESSPRGSLARRSLNIALLNPVGLAISFGLTGFTGKLRITEHTVLNAEMCMLCTNWPCLRIRSLPSSPLASTTEKTQQEPSSFTAKVVATGKRYWNGSTMREEPVLIFNFKGDWQQNKLKQGLVYARFLPQLNI